MLLRTDDCVRDKDPTDVMEEVGLCWALWECMELSLLDLQNKTPEKCVINGKFTSSDHLLLLQLLNGKWSLHQSTHSSLAGNIRPPDNIEVVKPDSEEED